MPLVTTFQSAVNTVETLSGTDLVGANTLTHAGFSDQTVLTASTTPDVTHCAYQTVSMTAGAATIDLTSLTLNGGSVTLDAKKPRFLKIKAPSTNANNVTVAKGASNGYDGLGSAFSIVLEPGMSLLVDFASGGNAVSSTNKNIDISGTGTQGVQLSIVGGT